MKSSKILRKPKVTKQTLLAYQKRWREVNQFTAQESAMLSPDQRLHQINLLMQLALEPTLLQQRDQYGAELVRARWVKLRTSLYSTR